MAKRNVIIMGAAGRDFHNFNVFFRNNHAYNVVAFTAAQIPDISGRKYPATLSGRHYPDGIPIFDEKELPRLIKYYNVEEVVLGYSDISNEEVMQKGALVIANGASFSLLGPTDTMLRSVKPVIAVCAVRTGSGKSALSRFIVNHFRRHDMHVVVIRHPMPYGDLAKQAVQRFETVEDLERHNCTIEEREEYEPHIINGAIVYAGVDYEKIIRQAEKEADVILWDGGNNDFPFYKPDLFITIADPHRPGHEISYYPGESNFMMADVIVIGKVNTAEKSNIELVERHAREVNPGAKIVHGTLEISAEDIPSIKGKRAIVIEDGPTLTHGGMHYGAGMIAAQKYGAKVIDARKFAVGSIRGVYQKYEHLDRILPAVGYGPKQMKELQDTINRSGCDIVLEATPANLGRIMKINKPIVNITYEFGEIRGGMTKILGEFERKHVRRK